MEPWRDQARTRTFHLWEYHAGHGALLIRSPKGEAGAATNLDLLCFDVAYIEAPRHLVGLTFAEPTAEETERVAHALGERIAGKTTHALVSQGNRYLVVAGQFVEDENDKDTMTTFLATQRSARAGRARR